MTESGEHAFISYAREDEDLARAMKDRLSDAGIGCLMDTGIILVGDDWRSKVRQMLNRSFVVIVVCTSRSANSHEVTAEWAYAMGVGVPVIPVIYKPGVKLGGLEALDRLDFSTVAHREWGKLIERVRSLRAEKSVTRATIMGIGVQQIFASRHELLARYSLKSLLGTARENSELFVVGRSLEGWSREFQRIQIAMEVKSLRVKMAVVTPNLARGDWMIPDDYASLDLSSSIEKFGLIQPVPDMAGSFDLYFLPNSAVFSFTYFEDIDGPCGIIELGANLAFEERFSIILRSSSEGYPSLLGALLNVYKGMVASRKAVISIGAAGDSR